MKSDNWNNHALRDGGEVVICRTSISPFLPLAQHLQAQFALSQIGIMSLCACVKQAESGEVRHFLKDVRFSKAYACFRCEAFSGSSLTVDTQV
ncbi:MAG: hypothetical protein R3B95_15860 [Nitrospirales bacterium]|nr:hypothetical protein [Nitrospirales bacterium]